jgi:hypothetical protein
VPVLAELGRSPRFQEDERGRTVIVTAPMLREEPQPARRGVVVPALLLLVTLAALLKKITLEGKQPMPAYQGKMSD